MILLIKGMVCQHCVRAVETALAKAGISGARVELGRVDAPDSEITATSLTELDRLLEGGGFTRISNRDEEMVERVKHEVIKYVRKSDNAMKLSAVIADAVGSDYTYVSRVFSAMEGRTIERYAILQRVEYVKELLAYGELTISEIAWRAGYSSVAHLSRQFKEVTGMTPTAYLKTSCQRSALNDI